MGKSKKGGSRIMRTPREILVNTYDKTGKLIQKIVKSNDERIVYGNGQHIDTFGTHFDVKSREVNRNPDRIITRGGHWDYDLDKFVWNKTKSYEPMTKEQKIAKLQAQLNALLAS